MHDIQVSIEITLKYVLLYHKCLSVHSVHFNHVSKTIEVGLIMKLHIIRDSLPKNENCVTIYVPQKKESQTVSK